MSGLFNTVVAKIPRRNAFGRSYESHLTTDFGKITPCLCEEVYPADDFRIRTEAVIKLAEMLAPAMARIDAYIHYFFVPNRLLYADWENFITGGKDGMSPNGTQLAPVIPSADINDLVNGGYCDQGKLGDYFNLPSLAHNSAQVYAGIPPISLMPFLAYQKIYSDWYKDELLSSVADFEPHAGGFDSTNLASICALRYRAWKKDYFTSARPDTQLGPQFEIPLTGSLSANGPFRLGQSTSNSSDSSLVRAGVTEEDLGSSVNPRYAATIKSALGYAQRYVDGISLDEAGILVNSLRYSLKGQEWAEKNMRGGNRYIENIFHHFGVRSSDARLQRSQYLGGRKIPIMIGEVLQQTDTVGDAQYSSGARYLGSRGGVGNAAGSTQSIHFYSEEHGFIIGLLSIMPHASYMQGIPRMFADRWDRFSYMWPEFGNLGEQEIYNWELYVAAGSSNHHNDEVFGYQSRYADLKQNPSQIHGEFRSSLAYWHTARIFSTRPSLNDNFVKFPNDATAGGVNRIFAVPSNDLAAHFRCHLLNKISVLRMLPKYGIPSL